MTFELKTMTPCKLINANSRMANPFPIDGGADPVENPFMTPEEALANSVSVH